MLPSLLILSVSLQLAWTCLPMKPAEDMHCPSVPLAAAVNEYAVDGLKKSIVNGAEVYSCEPKAVLLEVDGTAVKETDGGKISCMPNSGIFVDDKMLAVNQKKYNCGKKADNCNNCKKLVNDVFDLKLSEKNDPVPANPVCVTTCMDGSDIYVNNVRHDKVICSMATDKVTVDSAGGEVLTDGNRFTCTECGCDSSQANDGKAGLCPPDKLCDKPTLVTACKGTCPPNSQALYKDKDTGVLKKSQTFQCQSGTTNWIADVYDSSAGVTCQYDDGKGYTPDRPTVDNPCQPLQEEPCPTTPADCSFNEIVYVSDGGGGYKAMCKNGRLITNINQNEDGDPELLCQVSAGGMWPSTVTSANCITNEAELVKKCTAMLPASVTYNSACSFGSCSITCKVPGQKFMYDLDGGAAGQTSAYLLCPFGDLADPSKLAYPLPATVKCV